MGAIVDLDVRGLNIEEICSVLQHTISQGPPLIKLRNLPVGYVNTPTPSDWRQECTTVNDKLFFDLCSTIGTVFGYANLQDGNLIQEIFPIRSDANKQVGSGAVKLELHTEDPALEYRADYLSFLCVSNADRIPTMVSVPNLSKLSDKAAERLSRPVFRILSDRPSNGDGPLGDIVTAVLRKDANGRPKLIYDPVYIVREEMSLDDLRSFEELESLVEDCVQDFLLEPGEIGIVDNYQVAHGRPQYQPRYDGTDRWLKRIQISLNLDAFAERAIVPGKLMP